VVLAFARGDMSFCIDSFCRLSEAKGPRFESPLATRGPWPGMLMLRGLTQNWPNEAIASGVSGGTAALRLGEDPAPLPGWSELSVLSNELLFGILDGPAWDDTLLLSTDPNPTPPPSGARGPATVLTTLLLSRACTA